jgi:hypothetical protein
VVAATGIPVGNIFVGATHTHAGPDLQGLWGGVSAAYKQVVVDGTVAAIVDAFRQRAPARLTLAKGTGFANNRRGWGYTDDELTVLDAHALSDGARLGTLIQFAAHPTTLSAGNLLISSDYCHYLRLNAEAALNATVVFFNGAIGDVTPRGSGSEYARAESYGNEVAAIALDSLRTGAVPVNEVELVTYTTYYRHPVTNPLFLLADALGLLDYDFNEEDNSVNMQASYFRIGSALQGVAFPGESLTNNALPIKAAMTAPFRLFLGLTGDTLGYFIPTDEWLSGRNGNYEETISINKFVGDVTRDALVALITADPEAAQRAVPL